MIANIEITAPMPNMTRNAVSNIESARYENGLMNGDQPASDPISAKM